MEEIKIIDTINNCNHILPFIEQAQPYLKNYNLTQNKRLEILNLSLDIIYFQLIHLYNNDKLVPIDKNIHYQEIKIKILSETRLCVLLPPVFQNCDSTHIDTIKLEILSKINTNIIIYIEYNQLLKNHLDKQFDIINSCSNDDIDTYIINIKKIKEFIIFNKKSIEKINNIKIEINTNTNLQLMVWINNKLEIFINHVKLYNENIVSSFIKNL